MCVRACLYCRPDRTMQDIVYKLVPGLYKSELQLLVLDKDAEKRIYFLICFVYYSMALSM